MVTGKERHKRLFLSLCMSTYFTDADVLSLFPLPSLTCGDVLKFCTSSVLYFCLQKFSRLFAVN